METKLMTISQIKKEYGIPTQTLYNAYFKRELNFYKLQGKTFYVYRTELDGWIKSRLANKPLFRAKDFVR